jgi:hypothetical protein
MTIDTATLRHLAVTFQVDPRSIKRERDAPGCVRGMAGHRARAALATIAIPQPQHAAEATTE